MEDQFALLDLDGVLANYESTMRLDLDGFGVKDLPKDLHSDDLPDGLLNMMRTIKKEPGWWRNLPVIESGMQLMELCRDIGYNIHILTQGPQSNPLAWREKFEWCEEHVKPICPDYGISIVRNGKPLHYARVFVDDWPPFMEGWLENRPRGLGLMPVAHCNNGFHHEQVLRYTPEVKEWRTGEMEDRLRHAFERDSREN
tara:strand:+ start:1754 stop:2350 length:597 start_codon:yes stop_codon:yes gene_type:complete